MWSFLGLLVIAYVVYDGFRRLNRLVCGLGIIFERLGNRAAERQGEPPVLTKEDMDSLL